MEFIPVKRLRAVLLILSAIAVLLGQSMGAAEARHRRQARGEAVSRAQAVAVAPGDRLGADKGDVACALALAHQYSEGKGVRASKSEAAKLFKVAAAKGDPDALNSLGELLREGDGIGRDEKQAFSLFDKAANKGSVRAL